ncbi:MULTISPECIES: hypothetical protein [Streptomyces]|uniref:Uncharacterized protein n=1 Tax=Streptomyces dengpaensis TaxID=2049881 RepID=A0ABM6SZ09_9ACTN|nr:MULTISPECIES: hypothetical protein [Streptomyces]AVH59993.1 hypothetical protein C4B68_34145 [Streptomyces dengpaensis]PIB09631.1 hypothetical protein B1C81_10820 [Streptomyces sp. HG99]
MTDRRLMSARRAQEIIEGAELVKAPDWRDTRNWHVVAADGTVLVVVAPSYGGTSRTGRNGWKYFLAAMGPSGNRDPEPTRQQAAARGLAAWKRWVTTAARR